MHSHSGRWRPTARRALGAARAAEALVLVVAFAAAQRWVPTPRWARALGAPLPVPPEVAGRTVPACHAPAGPVERQVAVAVGRARRALPFDPSCLAQAAAGQIMLRSRRQPGTVLIGLQRTDDAWSAHAWLLGSDGVIIGGAAGDGFTPTMAFRPVGSQRLASGR